MRLRCKEWLQHLCNKNTLQGTSSPLFSTHGPFWQLTHPTTVLEWIEWQTSCKCLGLNSILSILDSCFFKVETDVHDELAASAEEDLMKAWEQLLTEPCGLTGLSTTVCKVWKWALASEGFPSFIGKRLYKVSFTSSFTSVYNAIKMKKKTTLC